jgi:hypothetical protein
MTPLTELEGTWEEILARAPELAGRRVRLFILPSGAAQEASPAPTAGQPPEQPPVFRPAQGPSTARSLLRFAGTWVGDDLDACLQEVYANRTEARF